MGSEDQAIAEASIKVAYLNLRALAVFQQRCNGEQNWVRLGQFQVNIFWDGTRGQMKQLDRPVAWRRVPCAGI